MSLPRLAPHDDAIVPSLRAWYCEVDRPGRATHLQAERDLKDVLRDGVLFAVEAGEPDERGGRRVRVSGPVPVDVRCRCGAFVRRRSCLPMDVR